MIPLTEKNEESTVIGALLLQRGLISQPELDKALAFQAQFKGRLGSILIRLGALSEDALLPVSSAQLGLTLLEPDQLPARSTDILKAIEASGLSPACCVISRHKTHTQHFFNSTHIENGMPEAGQSRSSSQKHN
jgi:hypothetical protein